MKGVLMNDAVYVNVCGFLAVLFICSVVAKIIIAYSALINVVTSERVNDAEQFKAVRSAFKFELISGGAYVLIGAIWLMTGFVAPHADWYAFESRIVVVGLAGLLTVLHGVFTVLSFVRERKTEDDYAREVLDRLKKGSS